jgi:hypothetical protein
VINGDGITVTYVSQATATTDAGTYTSGPYAITPVLADPNNRLSNYNATLNDGTLTIVGVTNTITFPQISPQTYGNPPVALTASATSGQPVTYTVSGPATLGNNQLQLAGAGMVTVTASQPAKTTRLRLRHNPLSWAALHWQSWCRTRAAHLTSPILSLPAA